MNNMSYSESAKKNNLGFSLIELLVSVAMFSVLIMIVLSIFQTIIIAQRNAIATQSVQESLRFAFEVISKEMRSAQRVYDNAGNNLCDPGGVGSTNFKVYNKFTDGNGVNLYFMNRLSECVHYYVNGTDHRLYIGRNSVDLPITPDDIEISDFDIKITDDIIGAFPTKQPKVTIRMTAKKDTAYTMELQTTITSRHYE